MTESIHQIWVEHRLHDDQDVPLSKNMKVCSIGLYKIVLCSLCLRIDVLGL